MIRLLHYILDIKILKYKNNFSALELRMHIFDLSWISWKWKARVLSSLSYPLFFVFIIYIN